MIQSGEYILGSGSSGNGLNTSTAFVKFPKAFQEEPIVHASVKGEGILDESVVVTVVNTTTTGFTAHIRSVSDGSSTAVENLTIFWIASLFDAYNGRVSSTVDSTEETILLEIKFDPSLFPKTGPLPFVLLTPYAERVVPEDVCMAQIKEISHDRILALLKRVDRNSGEMWGTEVELNFTLFHPAKSNSYQFKSAITYIGSNSANSDYIKKTIQFPSPFPSTPHIIVTPRSDPHGSTEETMVANIYNVTNASFTAVIRKFGSSGWRQNLYLSYCAYLPSEHVPKSIPQQQEFIVDQRSTLSPLRTRTGRITSPALKSIASPSTPSQQPITPIRSQASPRRITASPGRMSVSPGRSPVPGTTPTRISRTSDNIRSPVREVMSDRREIRTPTSTTTTTTEVLREVRTPRSATRVIETEREIKIATPPPTINSKRDYREIRTPLATTADIIIGEPKTSTRLSQQQQQRVVETEVIELNTPTREIVTEIHSVPSAVTTITSTTTASEIRDVKRASPIRRSEVKESSRELRSMSPKRSITESVVSSPTIVNPISVRGKVSSSIVEQPSLTNTTTTIATTATTATEEQEIVSSPVRRLGRERDARREAKQLLINSPRTPSHIVEEDIPEVTRVETTNTDESYSTNSTTTTTTTTSTTRVETPTTPTRVTIIEDHHNVDTEIITSQSPVVVSSSTLTTPPRRSDVPRTVTHLVSPPRVTQTVVTTTNSPSKQTLFVQSPAKPVSTTTSSTTISQDRMVEFLSRLRAEPFGSHQVELVQEFMNSLSTNENLTGNEVIEIIQTVSMDSSRIIAIGMIIESGKYTINGNEVVTLLNLFNMSSRKREVLTLIFSKKNNLPSDLTCESTVPEILAHMPLESHKLEMLNLMKDGIVDRSSVSAWTVINSFNLQSHKNQARICLGV